MLNNNHKKHDKKYKMIIFKNSISTLTLTSFLLEIIFLFEFVIWNKRKICRVKLFYLCHTVILYYFYLFSSNINYLINY